MLDLPGLCPARDRQAPQLVIHRTTDLAPYVTMVKDHLSPPYRFRQPCKVEYIHMHTQWLYMPIYMFIWKG